MNQKDIPALVAKALSVALTRKGQFAGFVWERKLATRKGVSDTVTKTVRCVAMLGANHDNRKAVQEARANGDAPATNQGLAWGEYVLYPYLIAHKGKLYLRIYPVAGNSPKVSYRLNGQRTDRATVESLCLAKEFGTVAPHECITLGVENLRSVK